jgi:twinkle protein
MSWLEPRTCELLEARGFDIELVARLGVRSCDRFGDSTIEIPYYRGDQVVGRKYRTLAGPKKFAQEVGSEQIFYNRNVLADPGLALAPVIATEGELDCWAGLQAGFPRVVSVPGGAPSKALGNHGTAKYAFLDEAPSLALSTQWILATDDDEAGHALREDLALRLGHRRCQWLRYPKGCKDLADALQRYGERGVVESLARAQWMVGNVYRLQDVAFTAPPQAMPSGFPGLDEHYRLRLGDLCVVTGIPSMGKTAFVGDLACRMALRHDWPVCFASFEQSMQDQRRMLRTWKAGAIEASLDAEQRDMADAWINERFCFVLPDADSRPSLAWLLERFAVAALRYEAKLFVLDPWNELEHERPKDMSMTEYVGDALHEIKAFARHYGVHVIVVAHPMKMHRDKAGHYPIPSLYDISDSAHWYNRPEVGIVVHRQEDGSTLIRVAKSRYHDQIGKPGDVAVRYVWQRATYEAIEQPAARTPYRDD